MLKKKDLRSVRRSEHYKVITPACFSPQFQVETDGKDYFIFI